MDEFKDDEVYAVELSMGGVNAFSHDCGVVGYRPGYAVCLHKVAAYNRNDTKSVSAECCAAIRDKLCPALSKRAEELAKGQAIYFIHRVKQRDFYERLAQSRMEQFRPGERNAPKQRPATKSKPVTPPKEHFVSEPGTAGGTYADAINAAIRELPPTPAGPAAPTPAPAAAPAAAPRVSAPVAVKAGMSLIEMARAQLAAKANHTAKE